jgi:hypothetical protein
LALQGDDADLVVLVGVLHQTASLVAPLAHQRLAPPLDCLNDQAEQLWELSRTVQREAFRLKSNPMPAVWGCH